MSRPARLTLTLAILTSIGAVAVFVVRWPRLSRDARPAVNSIPSSADRLDPTTDRTSYSDTVRSQPKLPPPSSSATELPDGPKPSHRIAALIDRIRKHCPNLSREFILEISEEQLKAIEGMQAPFDKLLGELRNQANQLRGEYHLKKLASGQFLERGRYEIAQAAEGNVLLDYDKSPQMKESLRRLSEIEANERKTVDDVFCGLPPSEKGDAAKSRGDVLDRRIREYETVKGRLLSRESRMVLRTRLTRFEEDRKVQLNTFAELKDALIEQKSRGGEYLDAESVYITSEGKLILCDYSEITNLEPLEDRMLELERGMWIQTEQYLRAVLKRRQ